MQKQDRNNKNVQIGKLRGINKYFISTCLIFIQLARSVVYYVLKPFLLLSALNFIIRIYSTTKQFIGVVPAFNFPLQFSLMIMILTPTHLYLGMHV